MELSASKRILRVCSAGTAVCLLAGMLCAAPAAKADSLSDQYASLQKQQQALQAQIDSGNAQIATDSKVKSALDQSVSVILQQTAILNSEITASNTKIEAKKRDISATQADIDKNYSLYKQQLRAMYESGDASYIRVLLSSGSFTDFLKRAEVLKVISERNNSVIDQLNQDKQKLSAEKSALESEQVTLQNNKAALTAKQAEVDAQIAKQTAVISASTADVSLKKSQQSKIDDELYQIAVQQAAQRKKEIEAQQQAASGGSSSGTGSGGQSSGGTSSGGSTQDPGKTGGSTTPVTGVTAQAIVNYAEQFYGKPYILNTAGPNYFDCSGLTMRVFAHVAGIALPHDADAQYNDYGTHVSSSNLRTGDLVFFNTSGGYGYMSHVGIYLGNDYFIAANTSTGVTKCRLFGNSYWSRYYRGATRLI